MNISALKATYSTPVTSSKIPDFAQRQQQQVTEQNEAVKVTLTGPTLFPNPDDDSVGYDLLKRLRNPTLEKLTGLKKLMQGTLDQRLGLDRPTLEKLEEKIAELQAIDPRTDAEQLLLENLLKERAELIAKTARELDEKEQTTKAEKAQNDHQADFSTA